MSLFIVMFYFEIAVFYHVSLKNVLVLGFHYLLLHKIPRFHFKITGFYHKIPRFHCKITGFYHNKRSRTARFHCLMLVLLSI